MGFPRRPMTPYMVAKRSKRSLRRCMVRRATLTLRENDFVAAGHSSGKRPEHGLTVEQGRFLEASESTDVPYIVTKLAARAFWRCMGSWGSDQISAIDKLRKIIACSRGATAAAGVIFAGLSLAGICSEHSEPLYRQKAGDESFLSIPGFDG